MYVKKGNSKREPCPLRRSIGIGPKCSHINTPVLLIHWRISVNNEEIIEPLDSDALNIISQFEKAETALASAEHQGLDSLMSIPRDHKKRIVSIR